MAKNNPTGDSGQWGYDADILNDSISMNMEDDSFDGNESTLILPSKPVVNPSSSNNPKTGPAHPGQSVPSTSKDPFNDNTVDHQSSPSPEEEQAEEPRSQQSNTTNRDEWMRRELARNRDLENERDWLRGINKMLEASADEMSQIKQKLQNVQTATQTSHDLLDLYSKILNQTEHTKDLLSDPTWQGLSADMKRRAEAKEAEKKRQEEERAREREEELIREREQQRLEAEAAAEAARKQSQLGRSTRGSGSGRRGRGTGSTAGRSVRGQSRIGRFTR
ncbi:hypothetical protein PSTG_08964 [Puccinia striiformis f. sp. tritici PST-78]|uniref:DASH complex subunit DUO1 n=2 Tax=Puccinia striiformis f. sp. tritici TaxID=168172 RepID=A0A0L0VEN8_9BASI|nr:hypothetical protein PSTG_08964 [Puccinia striiformis f. sp. tritici PST-78]